MNTARYAIAVLTVTFMPPALIWWLIVHPFVGFWRWLGAKKSLWVLGVTGMGAVLALWTIRDSLVGADLGESTLLFFVAALLLTGSVWISLKRRKHLTSRILSGVPELSADDPGHLLSEGIYARIRHPRYVEVVLGTFAYTAFANYVGAYVVAVLTVPLLHLVVLLEERELRDRFGGAYEAYAARVPRYIPGKRA